MLRVTILCVGKLKERYLTEAVAEYDKRLGRYCKIRWIEVPDESTPAQASQATEDRIRETEGERLLHAAPADAYRIALDMRGEALSSEDFAAMIDQIQTETASHLVFFIGGSLGLSSGVLSAVNKRISFSKLTFPHQLMRVILDEQLYRAFRIIHNEPYHK